LAIDLIKGLAKKNSFGQKVFCGFPVSSLIVKTVKMDGVPRYVQWSFFFAGDCLLPDVIYVLCGIAADEYVFGVTKVSGLGDELVDFRNGYCA
jgi:hypothetical protein